MCIASLQAFSSTLNCARHTVPKSIMAEKIGRAEIEGYPMPNFNNKQIGGTVQLCFCRCGDTSLQGDHQIFAVSGSVPFFLASNQTCSVPLQGSDPSRKKMDRQEPRKTTTSDQTQTQSDNQQATGGARKATRLEDPRGAPSVRVETFARTNG